MPMEGTNSSPDPRNDNKHEKLDSGVRDMFSAITSRIFRHHNAGSSSLHNHPHQGDSDDDRGIRVITLAGNNTGATLQGGQEDHKSGNGHQDDGDDLLGTYVNSNFQAINNSIMMGGSYEANDPGVHAEITDFVEHKHKLGKKDKKKKKKVAESE